MSNNICFIINDEKLYMEQSLVELDYPILYTCLDQYKNRYLVLCIDGEEPEYLVVDVTNKDLFKMLNKQMPMRDIFLMPAEAYLIQPSDEIDKDIVQKISTKELTDQRLPVEKALFEIVDEEITNFISKLECECTRLNFVMPTVTQKVNYGTMIDTFKKVNSEYKNKIVSKIINRNISLRNLTHDKTILKYSKQEMGIRYNIVYQNHQSIRM